MQSTFPGSKSQPFAAFRSHGSDVVGGLFVGRESGRIKAILPSIAVA